jgi:hypothetical protein
MTRRAFYARTWVQTPDGEGEITDYDREQDRPYYVLLDRPGVDASADNLCQYAESDLKRIAPPRWKRMRDRERRRLTQ